MPRPQIVIENPILNTPFAVPARHFRFDDDGKATEFTEWWMQHDTTDAAGLKDGPG